MKKSSIDENQRPNKNPNKKSLKTVTMHGVFESEEIIKKEKSKKKSCKKISFQDISVENDPNLTTEKDLTTNSDSTLV